MSEAFKRVGHGPGFPDHINKDGTGVWIEKASPTASNEEAQSADTASHPYGKMSDTNNTAELRDCEVMEDCSNKNRAARWKLVQPATVPADKRCDHPVAVLLRLQVIGRDAFSAAWMKTPMGTEPKDAEQTASLAQIAAVRLAVIEECARVVDQWGKQACAPYIAEEIRALK